MNRRAQEHKARKLAYKAEKALQRNRDTEEVKTHSSDLTRGLFPATPRFGASFFVMKGGETVRNEAVPNP